MIGVEKDIRVAKLGGIVLVFFDGWVFSLLFHSIFLDKNKKNFLFRNPLLAA